jgi:DNA-binding transcriptional LysR family regulator
MDHLDAMRIFVAVATEGSFVKGARSLRLSPSVVTRSISYLEDHLGLVLFTRTTRSVRLTERGQFFLEDSRQILEDLARAESRARGEDAEPRGELTVAAPVMLGRLHVTPIVDRLLTDHPGLSVRLMLSDRNVRLVEEGVDVAVRIGELSDSRLLAMKLGEVSRVVAASPRYLEKNGRPKTPDDLVRHEIVAFDSLDATDEWRFRAQDKVVRLRPRLTVNAADAALVACEAGIGLARVLSYQLAAAVAAGRLVPVLQEFEPPPFPVSAIYPARRFAAPNTAAFVIAARMYFKTTPLSAIGGDGGKRRVRPETNAV